jgi:hypothetical protein
MELLRSNDVGLDLRFTDGRLRDYIKSLITRVHSESSGGEDTRVTALKMAIAGQVSLGSTHGDCCALEAVATCSLMKT